MKLRTLFLILLLSLAALGLNAQTNAVFFDGDLPAANTDYIGFGDLGFTGITYTAECWIYPTSLTNPETQYMNVIMATSSAIGNYTMCLGTWGTEIRVWSYVTTPTTTQTTGAGLTINTWYHVAVTATKGGITKVYINGVEKLSFTNPGLGVNWSNRTDIGDLRPGRGIGFKGRIADFRIWNVVLSQAQIQYGMNNDLVGNETGLIGYWPLHEGTGTIVYDHVLTAPHNGTFAAPPADPSWAAGQSSITLASTNPAIPAANAAQSEVKHSLYRFTLTAVGVSAIVNQVTVNTAGTYIPADITNLKLWSNTTDDLGTATQIGSILTASLGTGSHIFSGLTQAITLGSTDYFWVTADVSSSATPGNTINVAALTTGEIILASGFKTGVAYAGGNQIITTLYDYPPYQNTTFAGLTINVSVTSLGGGLDYVAPTTPAIPNPSFVTGDSYALTGTGSFTFSLNTAYEFGAYWQNGVWNSVVNSGGSITFTIDFDVAKAVIQFILGNQDPTLPIELSSFTVTQTSEYFVQLHWVTQSETDVAGYYVYRNTSTDLGTSVVVSPFIPATNTSSEVSYSYTDEEVTPGMWYYWLQNMDMNGSSNFHGPISINLSGGGDDPTPIIPLTTSLDNIYPNPFNPLTTISFGLAKNENVSIVIYNMKGQPVRTLISEAKSSGTYRLQWNGNDNNGKALPSGVYYVKMTAGKYTTTQKAILMK